MNSHGLSRWYDSVFAGGQGVKQNVEKLVDSVFGGQSSSAGVQSGSAGGQDGSNGKQGGSAEPQNQAHGLGQGLSRLYDNVIESQGVKNVTKNVEHLVDTFRQGAARTSGNPKDLKDIRDLRDIKDLMGCTWSGLAAIYDAVSSGEEVKVNGRRFRIVQNLGEGGYAFVYLVREAGSSSAADVAASLADASSDPAADVATSGDGNSGNQGENAEPADESDAKSVVPTKPKRKYVSPDNTYALKKFLIQTKEQLLLVKAEIDVASKLDHPNLLPLVEHAIVSSKQQQGTKEAYLVFPVYRDGTIQDHVAWMAQAKGSQSSSTKGHRFSPLQVLTIISQVASGLAHMHACSPPLAHNDIKPGNILIAFGGHGSTGGGGVGVGRGRGDGICITGVAERDDAFVAGAGSSSGPSAAGAAAAGDNGGTGGADGVVGGGVGAGGTGAVREGAEGGLPLDRLPTASASDISVAIMDFGSTTPARREIRSRNQALSLQEWAAQHCSAAYRAPEFWDCPSEMDIDEKSDVWSLGCALYATMYGQSPFEFSLGESGGSLQLAVMSGTIKWPHPPLATSSSSASPPPALMDTPVSMTASGSSADGSSGFSSATGGGFLGYPASFHKLVEWMVQQDVKQRPMAAQVVERVEHMIATLPPSLQ
ncbi:hypothetical protein CLOP_g9513 [Closterium sp. NIES-67]|nr:hypothetical protein CLOP_g9513 [Closterium sp. NIES-67]